MKAMQVNEAGGNFQLVEKDIPKPASNQVRIKVSACGICHSDAFVKEGTFPGVEYPRVPGHEVIGTVDEVGDGVTKWKKGQRVGVGWHGGHCFTCEACRAGDFIMCENAQICGISYDGGYAEYMVAPQEAVAFVPEDLDDVKAAPLLCAGITTYNALRNTPARPGDLVAIQGIGGLGHLGVQYAHHMGFKTVAISRGKDKKELALQLGADVFIDAEAEDVAEVLQEHGGAKVILATAPSSKAIQSVIDGLGVDGQLLVVAATPDEFSVSPFQLLMKRAAIKGWPSGWAKDSEDTLQFSALADIAPAVETYPLEKANEAYDRMINNEARFRVVLTT
ncbi:MAG: alcohol dehydrogenase [Saprospiraceae bacterium]|nr:alcohol dehydrogenase [Saprospiraceae bacterium]